MPLVVLASLMFIIMFTSKNPPLMFGLCSPLPLSSTNSPTPLLSFLQSLVSPPSSSSIPLILSPLSLLLSFSLPLSSLFLLPFPALSPSPFLSPQSCLPASPSSLSLYDASLNFSFLTRGCYSYPRFSHYHTSHSFFNHLYLPFTEILPLPYCAPAFFLSTPILSPSPTPPCPL